MGGRHEKKGVRQARRDPTKRQRTSLRRNISKIILFKSLCIVHRAFQMVGPVYLLNKFTSSALGPLGGVLGRRESEYNIITLRESPAFRCRISLPRIG
ncbi:hypothetical protein NDU88_005438 [Pleurodeles waltl]|uniref:Uncharacterized protein n=1 Tax=Pleurodeles waltl TaxID=8319 RepID=A0AAV7TBB9_PLEWA|nr:hypothetical protein NDU88_005438 [Pleurodeles waltl]